MEKSRENKIKEIISKEVLSNINDISAQQIVRYILFSYKNEINWEEAFIFAMDYMPELQLKCKELINNM